MTSRAASTTRTGERILAAARSRYAAEPYDRLRLDDVARDAGVTTQTVIRRFGGKAGLIVSVAEDGLAEIAQARTAQSTAAPDEILHDLVAHYERFGALILKVYAEAPQIEGLGELAARGREYHVRWCQSVFEPFVPAGDAHDRRIAQILMLCDATTWRILRVDSGLEPAEVERAIGEMLFPLVDSPRWTAGQPITMTH